MNPCCMLVPYTKSHDTSGRSSGFSSRATDEKGGGTEDGRADGGVKLAQSRGQEGDVIALDAKPTPEEILVLVGALRGQNGGDREFQRIGEVELAVHVRKCLRQRAIHPASTTYQPEVCFCVELG